MYIVGPTGLSCWLSTSSVSSGSSEYSRCVRLSGIRCTDRVGLTDVSDVGNGMGRTSQDPRIIGNAVPRDINNSKDEILPGNARRAILEKKKAERPNPDRTRPVAVPL